MIIDPPDRKHSEDKLNEIEQRYQTLFDRASDGILLVSTSGKLIKANEAFARMHGYTVDEIQTMNLADLDPPEELAKIPERMKRILSEGSLRFTVDNYHKDGHIFPVEISASLIVVNGEPMVQSFARDITERKQLESMIAESEKKFHLLFDSANDGLILLDLQGRIQDINRIGHERLGYTKEEMVGRRISEFNTAESAAVAPLRIKDVVEKGVAFFEATHLRKDGVEMPVEINGRVIELAGEKRIFSVVRDITERKTSEEALRIAAITFESHDAVLITDANANIIRVNRAFERITGYSEQEVLGRNPRLLSSGKHDKEFYTQMWHQLLTSGTWSGELWDKHKEGYLYPKLITISAVKDDLGKTTAYVGVFSDITERKQAESEIHQLAFYDSLTGLPNRRMLVDRLGVAQSVSSRTKDQGALLFLDMDNFKTLNDTLGHAVGDMLLKQVAERLKSCVREGDTIARLGGDEFIVMLEDLDEDAFEASEQVKTVSEKVLSCLSRPFSLEGRVYVCTSSIGITLFQGKGQSIDELMKQADIAMYQAKKAGRNTMRFFDEGMQESISHRARLEEELRSALAGAQMQLYYQVQVAHDDRMIGAEALIRWNHPERGLIPPVEFIPLAEESSLIVGLGDWVLETGCRQLREWARNPLMRDLVLSLNISAQQLHQTDFVAKVKKNLEQYSVRPAQLKLELTESMLLQDTEDTIRTMYALRDIGVVFSLDDFGTGYSSLQYLRRLPLDSLKIDASFVRDIEFDSDAMSIVRSVIALAQGLNLDVIAEGVETARQKELLEAAGCMNYQGYLLGRPEPIERFEAQVQS